MWFISFISNILLFSMCTSERLKVEDVFVFCIDFYNASWGGGGSHEVNALSWHSCPQVTKRILYFMCSKQIPTWHCMGISNT